MPDFWLSCGHHLLDRDGGGGLLVTDEFLKAYLARPELAPPPDACAAERTLHAALLRDPRRPVTSSEIAAITDADARENWGLMIGLPAAGEIDVLNDENAETYWSRSDLFDMALDLTAGRRGLDALGNVIAQWVGHLLSVEVEIEPLTEAAKVNFTWYVGLDAEATR